MSGGLVSGGLEISELRIVAAGTGRPVVDGVSLRVAPGEVVGLVGGSGSGKTTLGRAALGRVRAGLRHERGTVRVGSVAIGDLGADRPSAARGARIGWAPEDPATALNPALRIRSQADAVLRSHEPDAAVRAARLAAVAGAVGLPVELLERHPDELSGGQLQRAALAIALVSEPDVVVLDEPTSGLDAPTAASVIETVRRRCADDGLAALCITHDLALAARLTDRLYVMRSGVVVEDGPTAQVLDRPTQDYTRRLVASLPAPAAETAPTPDAAHVTPSTTPPAGRSTPVLALSDLAASYGRTEVLRGVTLQVDAGEWIALVGPSGAGKTTLLRSVAGLHPARPGAVRLDGAVLAATARRRTRRQRLDLGLVLQHPGAAFNPRRPVVESVARPLRLAGSSRASARQEVDRMLRRVGLEPARAEARPDELSGGELQRAAIARAVVGRPRVLLCDEVTAALDTITQAGVIELLRSLRDELGVAIVFVTHDGALAESTADRTVVLGGGRLRERAVATTG